MENDINILLPDIYEPITDEMVRKAKKWTLLRNENAIKLSSLIETLLKDAIQVLTKIAYKYNCPPEQWQFSENKDLREEVAQVMSEIEEEIMALVEEYSLNETQDEKRHSSLLPWLMALSSKGTKDLKSTLHQRLRQFLYDTEAQIAAMKLAGYNQAKAITNAISSMHTVYATPEVHSAYNKQSAAMYLQSRGVHKGNVGLSSSGANNVESFGYQSATLGWEKSRLEREKEEGKAGYYVRRGSTFPCSICDDVCAVFHPIEDGMVLPVHSHCCCYAIFVNEKENQNTKNNVITEDFKQRRKEIRKEAYERFKDVEFTNKDVSWKATISNGGIKEWLNQPHKHIVEKNEALLDMQSLFYNAEYIKPIKDDKDRQDVVTSHIFKTNIAGDDSWIIVHEMSWSEYQIYSIADNNPIK